MAHAGTETFQSLNTSGYVSGRVYRLPSSVSHDDSMPAAKGNGYVESDISGCPVGNAAYSDRLVRNRTAMPDQVIVDRSMVRFCSAKTVNRGLTWSSGKFHWDVMVNYLSQPAGYGYLEAGLR